MNKNIVRNRKTILSAALIIAATASAFAQGNGIAGINEATSMVSMAEYPINKGIGRPVEFKGAPVEVLWQIRQ